MSLYLRNTFAGHIDHTISFQKWSYSLVEDKSRTKCLFVNDYNNFGPINIFFGKQVHIYQKNVPRSKISLWTYGLHNVISNLGNLKTRQKL